MGFPFFIAIRHPIPYDLLNHYFSDMQR